MNRVLPLVLAGAVLLAPIAAHAKDKPLEVSKDNFVSLQWSRSGGFAGISENYTVQNYEIIKPFNSGGGVGGGVGFSPSYSPPQVAPLSENQRKELLEQLKKAQIPVIAGNYQQEGLSDGFNETLTLTLSDKDNFDQSFTINNYGNKAPASYFVFTRYFGALLARKFGPMPVASFSRTPLSGPFAAPFSSQPASPNVAAPKE